MRFETINENIAFLFKKHNKFWYCFIFSAFPKYIQIVHRSVYGGPFKSDLSMWSFFYYIGSSVTCRIMVIFVRCTKRNGTYRESNQMDLKQSHLFRFANANGRSWHGGGEEGKTKTIRSNERYIGCVHVNDYIKCTELKRE